MSLTCSNSTAKTTETKEPQVQGNRQERRHLQKWKERSSRVRRARLLLNGAIRGSRRARHRCKKSYTFARRMSMEKRFSHGCMSLLVFAANRHCNNNFYILKLRRTSGRARRTRSHASTSSGVSSSSSPGEPDQSDPPGPKLPFVILQLNKIPSQWLRLGCCCMEGRWAA